MLTSSFSHVHPPTPRQFYLNRVAYKAWISGHQIETSPDWDSSQPLPLTFTRLEQIARQELARLAIDDVSWSIDGFEFRSIPAGQGLKWYFVVEMKPFWGSGPQGADRDPDSFCVYIDLGGKPGIVAPSK